MTRWLSLILLSAAICSGFAACDNELPPETGESDSSENEAGTRPVVPEGEGDADADAAPASGAEFRCGARSCQGTQPDGTGEYCLRDGDAYSCRRLPASCLGETPGCDCLENQACGDGCAESGDGHFTLSCD